MNKNETNEIGKKTVHKCVFKYPINFIFDICKFMNIDHDKIVR